LTQAQTTAAVAAQDAIDRCWDDPSFSHRVAMDDRLYTVALATAAADIDATPSEIAVAVFAALDRAGYRVSKKAARPTPPPTGGNRT
jgi:hypothetical protein